MIEKSKTMNRRKPTTCYWSERYETSDIHPKKLLRIKKTANGKCLITMIAMEDYFKTILDAHEILGHVGRTKIENYFKDRLHIPKKAVQVFLTLCPVCSKRMPTSASCFVDRGQVNLIDFQSVPDGDYKWILNYQNLKTKFIHLRPLISMDADEAAFELLQIFSVFGAPEVLHSDHEMEFVAEILRQLQVLRPDWLIVNGRSKDPRYRRGYRINRTVETTLRRWMKENNSSNWSKGCYVVQCLKNNSFAYTIGMSPYRAVFGTNPKTAVVLNVPGSNVSKEDKDKDVNKLLIEVSDAGIEIESPRPRTFKIRKYVINFKNNLLKATGNINYVGIAYIDS